MPRIGNKWDQRIDRALELAAVYPFSAQILLFYSKLTTFQKSSYLELESSLGLRKKAEEGRDFTRAAPTPLTHRFVVPPLPLGEGPGLRVAARYLGGAEAPPFHSLPPACAEASAGMPALDGVNLSLLITRWGPFLSMLACEAPASLAEFARGLDGRDPSAGAALLRSFWLGDQPVDVGAPFVGAPAELQEPLAQPPKDGRGDRAPGRLSDFERFCAHAFLQPYAELLADRAAVPTPAARRPTCPFCGSLPLLSVLRQEGDGAKRSLVCSFCRTEWDYLRIACPACEESREEKLQVYSTPAFKCVRVDACETCRAYIKTIDLTQNGLAVPEADELAALPLTLWADEKGYNKVTWNIMGL